MYVLRERLDYPALKARAIAHARAYNAHKILIEDAGVGTALIQELKKVGLPGNLGQAGAQQENSHVNSIREVWKRGLIFFPPDSVVACRLRSRDLCLSKRALR